jgi:ribonuclease BN (tRNA processing enzyme)
MGRSGMSNAMANRDAPAPRPRLRAIGVSGSAVLGDPPTSYLIGDDVAIDAGAIASAIDLATQRRVRHVLLTHAHCDHTRDLPLFLANVYQPGTEPVRVHGLGPVLSALHEHVFNGVLWPKLTEFSPPPVVFQEINPDEGFDLQTGDTLIEVHPFASYHGVPATGYLIRYPSEVGPTTNEPSEPTHSIPPARPAGPIDIQTRYSALALTTDTGYDPAFFEALGNSRDLTTLVVEVSFPERMRRIAELSYHLTPSLLERGLTRVRRSHPDLRVYVTHLKPAYRDEIEAELAALDPLVRVLRSGDELSW